MVDHSIEKIKKESKNPTRKRLLFLIILCSLLITSYSIWQPGEDVTDGRHDRRNNGIWIAHGWLGDDLWFTRFKKNPRSFRAPHRIESLSSSLKNHHINYVFPHLCPCSPDGRIAVVDHHQTEVFLDKIGTLRVLPWVGGVLGEHAFPESKQWRSHFIASIEYLLKAHPRLAGIHVNIEPMQSGNESYLILLRELRIHLPPGKKLSVAAYPSSIIWQQSLKIHWSESYLEEVAGLVDQVVVMMYDTSIPFRKVYQSVMASWTRSILTCAKDTEVLLGIPAYEDSGVGYHHPGVENIENSLLGIHAGLNSFNKLPDNYQGVAVYCEWEMNKTKWDSFQKQFMVHK